MSAAWPGWRSTTPATGRLSRRGRSSTCKLIERAHAAGALAVYIQHASDKVLPFGSADW
jgi:hypothetical protein